MSEGAATRPPSIGEDIQQQVPFRTRSQEAYLGLVRAADDLKRRTTAVLGAGGVTLQQYNVLRILRGAGNEGLPTLTIGERMIERTPGVTRLAWRFLLSAEHVPSWLETGFDIVWIVMLLAPFGFWLRPTRNSAVGGTVIIAALIFGPSITGTLKIPLVEWVRGGIGLGIGVLLGAWARRRCASPHSSAAATEPKPGITRD